MKLTITKPFNYNIMITTKNLANRYLYEVEDKLVDVHELVINQDSEVVVISTEGIYHFIPLLDYITFAFNSCK